MKILLALFLASVAQAGPLINGNQINPQTAISIATFTVTGAAGMAVTNSVTASSFTASGSGFKGAGTGLTGTAASLTAGNVTTNANLTGGVTSVGNAATVVTNANLTGGVTSVGNAATVVTNANLTGDVTSVGNATTAAATQANIKVLSGLTTISNSFTLPSGSSATFNGGALFGKSANFSATYSSAALVGVTTTTTAGFQCLSNSTLTWTSNGNLATVKLQATGGNTTATASFIADVLLDGSVVAPQNKGSAISAIRVVDTGGGGRQNVSFSFEFIPSVGAHNVCLSYWGGASGALIDSANNIAVFSVWEP